MNNSSTLIYNVLPKHFLCINNFIISVNDILHLKTVINHKSKLYSILITWVDSKQPEISINFDTKEDCDIAFNFIVEALQKE